MSEKSTNRSTTNRILNALPLEEYERLAPHLKPVTFESGQILYKPNELIKHVYFTNNAMVSIVSTTTEGQNVEVGVIGSEGMVGMPVLLGVDSTPNEYMAQLPDGALQLETFIIKAEFKRSGVLQDVLLRFLYTINQQISQSAVCNRLHSIEQRLARWLLMCHDRSPSDDLPLTQEFLSLMLGVNRPSVTIAAIALQGGGFIRYLRGMVTILDREGLEDFACGCYGITKAESDRLA